MLRWQLVAIFGVVQLDVEIAVVRYWRFNLA